MCILVDETDRIIGKASKEECHLNVNIEKGLLHRAFSVFLFQDGKLLLQKRSDKKITFPDCWTNTCCSHPLHTDEEMNGVEGARIAAQRKLGHELSIPANQVPIRSFKYLTRIHYKATTDEKWGEHEMDYIFFVQTENVSVNPNAGEVKDHRFVTIDEVKQIVQDAQDGKVKISPWFGIIFDKFLLNWWNMLLQNRDLPEDDPVIHKF